MKVDFVYVGGEEKNDKTRVVYIYDKARGSEFFYLFTFR